MKTVFQSTKGYRNQLIRKFEAQDRPAFLSQPHLNFKWRCQAQQTKPPSKPEQSLITISRFLAQTMKNQLYKLPLLRQLSIPQSLSLESLNFFCPSSL